jgi:branched-chain amino acid aminotransferase
MKAYRQANGRIVLFRPEQNIARFNESAERMCMPKVDSAIFLAGLKKLISLEKEWTPDAPGCSLYIRPTYIATEAVLGVRPSSKYLFFIILSPSGPYFKEGFKPVKILVSDKYVRAAPGGVGFAKTGGNYAASLRAMQDAAIYNAPQVLWLDATQRKYIEEVGSMNFMMVKNGVIYTAPLDKGTILPGVTRDSILTLCKDLNLPYKEQALAIDDVIAEIQTGEITEAFGVGTAAVVSPVGELIYKGNSYVVNDHKVGPIAEKLYKTLTDIQKGLIPDIHDWIVPVE